MNFNERIEGKEKEHYRTNGLNFLLVKENDGWWSIYLRNTYTEEYTPKIQSKDLEHAKSWCDLCEPVTVPLIKI